MNNRVDEFYQPFGIIDPAKYKKNNKVKLICDTIRTICIVLIFLIIISLAIIIYVYIDPINNYISAILKDMNKIGDAAEVIKNFISKIDNEITKDHLLDETSIIINDARIVMNQLKYFNRTLIMNYIIQVTNDLNKIAKAIP